MTTIQRVGLGFVGLVLLAVAGLLLWMSTKQGSAAAKSEDWVETTGVVELTGFNGVWVKRGPAPTMIYTARVVYTYEVHGVPHKADRIGFSDEWLGAPGEAGKARAQEQSAPWPVGAKVKVYYDPHEPSEAVLVKGGGVPFSSKSGVGMAIFMALGGIACLGFATRFKG